MDIMGNTRMRKSYFTDDVLVALGFIVFGISILFQASESYDDVMLFPQIIGFISIACGVIMCIIHVINPKCSENQGYGAIIICSILSILMFMVMTLAQTIGFFMCLFIICLAINLSIGKFCKVTIAKNIVRAVVLSVIMSVTVFIVFSALLGILTPRGIFV